MPRVPDLTPAAPRTPIIAGLDLRNETTALSNAMLQQAKLERQAKRAWTTTAKKNPSRSPTGSADAPAAANASSPPVWRGRSRLEDVWRARDGEDPSSAHRRRLEEEEDEDEDEDERRGKDVVAMAGGRGAGGRGEHDSSAETHTHTELTELALQASR